MHESENRKLNLYHDVNGRDVGESVNRMSVQILCSDRFGDDVCDDCVCVRVCE